MSEPIFSIGEALGFGWQAMKRNFWRFAGILIVGALISLLPNFVMDAIGFAVVGKFSGPLLMAHWPLALRLLVRLVAGLISLVTGIGYVGVALAAARGERPSLSVFFGSLKRYWQFLAASACYIVIVFFGIILLVVPGVIWTYMFMFAPYFALDRGYGPIRALKASAAATRGYKFDLFGFWFVTQIVNVAGILAIFLGLFFTVPTTMTAQAFLYRKLSERVPVR